MSETATKNKTGITHVIPHFIRKDAAKAIEFYKKAFGAEECYRLEMPNGQIMHADLKFGDFNVYICEEFDPAGRTFDAQTETNSHVIIHLHVEDVDAAYKRATDAGARGLMPPQDMFWGDRYSRLIDPFGQPWSLATHKEDLTPEQIHERMLSAPPCGEQK
ncbi:MAG: VOC family protein [Candidatus Melainabacteria bacterium]|nr:VOC family protein [Candidatus Melainabacteria bacterium]